MFFDVMRGKKPSVVGFCVGAVVGLVAITPAAGFVAIPQSIFIGVIAAMVSNLVVHLKSKTIVDDTLDVFPCHGIGGMVGMLMTGIFATKAVNAAVRNFPSLAIKRSMAGISKSASSEMALSPTKVRSCA